MKLPCEGGPNEIKSPARIRLERELNAGLVLPNNIELVSINYEEMNMTVRLYPDEGPFSGAKIDFLIEIPELYPHRPPKAKILQKIFHPNFDAEGHVCLNILRLDWIPVLSITSIFFGLLSVLLHPEGEEPLNQRAGDMILNDREEYDRIAKFCALGKEFEGIIYDELFH